MKTKAASLDVGQFLSATYAHGQSIGARLDILKTPNGWVKPKYEEARSHPPAGDPTWMWTFDAPVSPNRYQKVGFPTKLAAAQGCYAFVAAMRAGVEELEFTK